MRKDVAAKISSLMLTYGAKLDETVELVQGNCSEEEFKQYRSAVGKVMGFMLTEIMNPIYSEHPELKPTQLK